MRNAKQSEIVVVTGAAAGLGRAIAHPFAREAAQIGLLARGRAGVEGAKRKIEATRWQSAHRAGGCRGCRSSRSSSRSSRRQIGAEAQPVAPIDQPEVAADAAVYAAHSNRREVYLGAPTLEAILATRSRRHWLIGICRATVSTRSKPVSRKTPAGLTTYTSRWMPSAITAHTAAAIRDRAISACRFGRIVVEIGWRSLRME